MPNLFQTIRSHFRSRPPRGAPDGATADATTETTGHDGPVSDHDLPTVKDSALSPNISMAEIVASAIKSFRLSVPEYLASGVVDMSTGMLLGVDTVDDHPREILDLLAAATFDLFQGRTVTSIEDMWSRRRGQYQDVRYFQEILVNSQNLVHLFMRGTASPNIVSVVICRRAVNIGMLFAQARVVMKEMDTALA